MGYQVRHKGYGVYQGEFLGFGIWHPMSSMPEQGYAEFDTQEEAQRFIDFLCSPECAAQENRDDLIIEPFDEETSNRLVVEGEARFSARGLLL